MDIKIDPGAGIPIYLQIGEQIYKKITTGELSPGEKLPSVRRLAEQTKVNFNTVARAYRWLEEAGMISIQHGRGAYVWEKPAPEIAEQVHKQSLTVLSRRYLHQARQRGYTPAEILRVIQELIDAEEKSTLLE